MTVVQPQQESFIAGSVLTFTGTFTSATTGLPVDPTLVAFAYNIETLLPVYFNYDGGGHQITRVSAGVYQITIDTTGLLPSGWDSALMTCQFAGTSPGQVSEAIAIRLMAPDIPLVFS